MIRTAHLSPCGRYRWTLGRTWDAALPVLLVVKRDRPDLLLHGFGLKTTALADPLVRSMLHTADSMAWSFHARINGRNANDWREAVRWVENITARPVQHLLDLFSPVVEAA